MAFRQVFEKTKLQAFSVEKDFWVCWILRELFTLQGIGEHLTFKGGTSLSKAWKLIERFSEDVDLIVDKELLGFGGDKAPDKAPSNNKRKERLKELMLACRTWVQGPLLSALNTGLQASLGDTGWKLEIDPDVKDGMCLLFHYKSVFPPTEPGYIRPVVKIELGARGDDWPYETKSIQPYVIELFPDIYGVDSFGVRVLSCERTFLEKTCILHEETFRTDDKPRKIRMARHYYDVWCLLKAGVGTKAMGEKALFQRVAEHREIFFGLTFVDYTTHKPGTFRLLPPEKHLANWREDYAAMRGPMFFGEVPEFTDILKSVELYERDFNNLKW